MPAKAAIGAVLLATALFALPAAAAEVSYYPVPAGSHPHDVAPAPDGTVWYTAQSKGILGRLDPRTGKVTEVRLGPGSAPHGVIVGPDGAAWVTDGGQNAIVKVDPATLTVKVLPLPSNSRTANLNTAAFDRNGRLWFTGQNGVYGSADPATGTVTVHDAPGGRGPYGMSATADGRIFYASLAGSHIAEIDVATGKATVIQPPTPNQGARRVWPDSSGRVWVSEWNSGQVSLYDPKAGTWKSWKLPGNRPRAYAVFVDDKDIVWLSDFSANAIVRFDPASETFASFASTAPRADVRQLLGRPGEVWGAESAADRLVVVRTAAD
jgi:virginiamycin B lyase